MDIDTMKPTTIKWLAENEDNGWRSNALFTSLPRAFIKVGTLEPVILEVLSVHHPFPNWVDGADGLYTVFLTDENWDSLALEPNHEAWLDYSDVRPIEGWDDAAETVAPTLDKPFQPYTDMSEAFNRNLPEIGKPESVTCCITLEAGLIQIKLPGPLSGELSIEGKKLSLTMDISPAHEWETLIKKAVAEGSKVNLSFSVETFVVLSDEGEAA